MKRDPETTELSTIETAELAAVTGGLGPILGGLLKSLLGGKGGKSGKGEEDSSGAQAAAPKG